MPPPKVLLCTVGNVLFFKNRLCSPYADLCRPAARAHTVPLPKHAADMKGKSHENKVNRSQGALSQL